MNFSSPYLIVMNKCDLLPEEAHLPHDCVMISAKTGMGLDQLKRRIFQKLQARYVRAKLFVPYADSAKYAALRALVSEKSVEYTEQGTELEVIIPTEHAAKFQSFIK